MSTKYKFADDDKLYFVSLAVTNWIDLPFGTSLEAGFVTKAEECKFSSAIDYYDGKGLLEIIKLDALIV